MHQFNQKIIKKIHVIVNHGINNATEWILGDRFFVGKFVTH